MDDPLPKEILAEFSLRNGVYIIHSNYTIQYNKGVFNFCEQIGAQVELLIFSHNLHCFVPEKVLCVRE